MGRITSAHGITGWVKVFSYTDPIEQIFEYLPWQLAKGKRAQNLRVAEYKRQGKSLVARPEGYDSRDQAELLAGWEIRIERTQLPALPAGEFYWHELEGLTVVNIKGVVLGEVDYLLETGANDVMVVKSMAGSVDDRERLIPYVENRIVRQVDLAERRILVDWEADY